MKLVFKPALAALCLVFAHNSFADSQIEVEQAWSRETLASATNGIIYLTVVNLGDETDRLVGVETPIAGHASVHEVVENNGMLGMQPVSELTIGPGERKVLGPMAARGLHIMLEGLTRGIREGDTFPLTLTFEKAGPIGVRVTAAAFAAMEPPSSI